MHKLNDQWIEIIDGKEHMVKAVNSTYNCNGCAYLCHNGKCSHESILECPVYRIDAIIKDLGILRNGKLPSSFGVYPTTSAPEDENEPWCLYAWIAENDKIIKEVKAWGETEQQAIEAWNRRA